MPMTREPYGPIEPNRPWPIEPNKERQIYCSICGRSIGYFNAKDPYYPIRAVCVYCKGVVCDDTGNEKRMDIS